MKAASERWLRSLLLAGAMTLAWVGSSFGQSGSPSANETAAATAITAEQAGGTASLSAWKGLRVDAVEFEGVKFGANDPLPGLLSQQAGQVLDPAKVTASVRRLFASGRYRDIRVEGEREGTGMRLIYVGVARYFVGRVTIAGVKDERLTSLLEYATKLQPGTDFIEDEIATATEGVRQALASNGYFEPVIAVKTTVDEAGDQVNTVYTVQVGPQARVGKIALQGDDPGLTVEEVRKKGKLKQGSKVTRETTSNALTRLRAQYEKRDRMEATVSLRTESYDKARRQVDYTLNANQGPLVKVVVEGAKFSSGRLKLLLPIYQEGTIDNDLLNEGTYNLKDFLLQEGYFDATVSVRVVGAGTDTSVRAATLGAGTKAETAQENVVYSVAKGVKHKVESVTIMGNHYFDTDLLKGRMRVQRADAYLRTGRYSPALMKADVESILALYRANGFGKATISTSIMDRDTAKSGKKLKEGEIAVLLTIVEGPQQRFGKVTLAGVAESRMKEVRALLNAQEGQPFSLITLSGDRDALFGYYLSHGFEQAKIEVKQQAESTDTQKTDVTLNVTEGEQVNVDRVLESGRVHTRPNIVSRETTFHAGDPLDESALLDTQRRLYGLALFNEVTTAVQNPDGDDPEKNVLLQLSEARRWNVTYGFGMEAETGTPKEGVINPASAILLGLPPTATYSQEGKTGVSPRISLDVGRSNLRGTANSLTLHSSYGLLEEVANLTFLNPQYRGHSQLSDSVSGGYSNVQNITTFQASTLQADFRITQKVKKTDTFIYDFQFRRVAVNPATLQVSANLIPQLSQPVRVGGPGITWFHDKRDPGPLDATKGSYSSVQEFFATSKFGSEVNFNRTDVTNSTYYAFGRHKYVLARNRRLGFETTFGANPNVGSASCSTDYQLTDPTTKQPVGAPVNLLETNASCNAVPLPERLYAGGATSDRGFPINGAGPRDLQTGYPVGGNGVIVNSTELRLPAPTLPYLGDSLSFVLFHDMGNVFAHVSDMFPGIEHFHQPNQQSCANVSYAFGTCNFNYFSHAVGAGARYKTPVGPIRLDFSYNLNPPVYPVIYDFNGSLPYEGQASHFNFFFSIGQAF